MMKQGNKNKYLICWYKIKMIPHEGKLSFAYGLHGLRGRIVVQKIDDSFGRDASRWQMRFLINTVWRLSDRRNSGCIGHVTFLKRYAHRHGVSLYELDTCADASVLPDPSLLLTTWLLTSALFSGYPLRLLLTGFVCCGLTTWYRTLLCK